MLYAICAWVLPAPFLAAFPLYVAAESYNTSPLPPSPRSYRRETLKHSWRMRGVAGANHKLSTFVPFYTTWLCHISLGQPFTKLVALPAISGFALAMVTRRNKFLKVAVAIQRCTWALIICAFLYYRHYAGGSPMNVLVPDPRGDGGDEDGGGGGEHAPLAREFNTVEGGSLRNTLRHPFFFILCKNVTAILYTFQRMTPQIRTLQCWCNGTILMACVLTESLARSGFDPTTWKGPFEMSSFMSADRTTTAACSIIITAYFFMVRVYFHSLVSRQRRSHWIAQQLFLATFLTWAFVDAWQTGVLTREKFAAWAGTTTVMTFASAYAAHSIDTYEIE